MLSFKKWLETTGAARAHTATDLIHTPSRIQMTGDGGVLKYDVEERKRKRKDPEKLFGVKVIEKQKKK